MGIIRQKNIHIKHLYFIPGESCYPVEQIQCFVTGYQLGCRISQPSTVLITSPEAMVSSWGWLLNYGPYDRIGGKSIQPELINLNLRSVDIP